MLKSMTGFGRAEKQFEQFQIGVQIKSVNHRYSDFSIRLPRYYQFLEEKIHQLAASMISRGKVEIFVNIEQKESDNRQITLDEAVAEGYINALRGLEKFGLADDLTMSTLSRFDGIFHVEYQQLNEDALFAMVKEVFEQAMDEFMSMREAEGKRLEQDIFSHLENILAEVAEVEKRSPIRVEEYRARLEEKLRKILDDRNVDETLLITEAALFADKTDVGEETVRLRSHVKEFKAAAEKGSPVGKKLDFIIQEMNREANTIGSKGNDLETAQRVVELKSEIEKIREQIQNIE